MLVLVAGLAFPLISLAQSTPAQIRALIAANKLDEALQATNTELAKDKKNITYRFLKGLILTKQNHLDQAKAIFIQLTKEHPELPEPYNNLAVIYASQGDFDKAREALQEAIDTHPSYATAHENMGDIYAKMASRAYSHALQLDKSNSTAKAKLTLINELFSLPKTSPTMVSGPKAGGAAPAATTSAAPQPKEAEAKPPRTVAAANPPETIAAIKDTITGWVHAWTSQDVSGYLSYYSKDFRPPDNQTLKQWKKDRNQHLTAPKYIRISVSDVNVKPLGAEHAQATFTQEYQSDTYSDRVTKLLLFAREGKSWRIVQEATK
ncbi:MAG: tetratricopeptide repeat protein [Gammaproteobacteria bacterium]